MPHNVPMHCTVCAALHCDTEGQMPPIEAHTRAEAPGTGPRHWRALKHSQRAAERNIHNPDTTLLPPAPRQQPRRDCDLASPKVGQRSLRERGGYRRRGRVSCRTLMVIAQREFHVDGQSTLTSTR